MEARPRTPSQTLTVREVAEVLGLSPATVRKAIARGEMPGRRIGRSYRIHKATFDEWLSGPFGPAQIRRFASASTTSWS